MALLHRVILWVFYKLFFRYEVRGQENLPSKGGVVIAPNHPSYLDPPLILLILLGISAGRRVNFMAARRFYSMPVIGWFVRNFSLPVDTGITRPSVLKESVRRLLRGEVLVIFPEGGRSRDGEIGSGFRGVGLIAVKSHAKVVPALIEGTDQALPVGARFIRPAKIRVTFGRALEYDNTGNNRALQRRIADDIMKRIRDMRREGWKV